VSEEKRLKLALEDTRDIPLIVGEANSCVVKENHCLHVAMHPRYIGNIKLGIIQYFNEQTGFYNNK